MTTSTQRTNDYERHFVGDRQISVSHFYSLGLRDGGELFAAGYHYPDGAFVSGIWRFDGGQFLQVDRALFVPAAEPINLPESCIIEG
jgi:hypothetical protein